MKILILTLILCLFPLVTCFGAELLVKAKPHWLDGLSQIEIDKLIADEKIIREGYDARSQIGDIIVVKPDGWKWGKEECLPNFVVIKIPDLKYEDAKKYEESLLDITNIQNPKILKHRKYQIPKVVIDNAKQLSQTIIDINKQQKDVFITNIALKTK